jgi:heme-degrading monooxygenase HmoA
MFVTICTYRARAGEEDAIIALHEDWQRTLRPKVRGYLSGELLHNVEDPRAFVAITRYESEAAARAAAEHPEQVAWQQRLASLAEVGPTGTAYHSAWRDP